MPVHVEMRVPGLTLSFEKRGGFLWERDRYGMRTRFHRDADIQVLIDQRVILTCGRRLDGEQLELLAIEHQFDFVLSAQALDMLITVALEADLELILRIHRKV